jgi:uncharacterized membrane protein YgcG
MMNNTSQMPAVDVGLQRQQQEIMSKIGNLLTAYSDTEVPSSAPPVPGAPPVMPNNPKSKFTHLFYNKVDPQKRHLYHCPSHVKQSDWEAAEASNPDPTNLVPAPIIGVESLQQRVLSQQAEAKKLKEYVVSLKECAGSLKQSVSTSEARSENLKAEQIVLDHRLLQVRTRQREGRIVIMLFSLNYIASCFFSYLFLSFSHIAYLRCSNSLGGAAYHSRSVVFQLSFPYYFDLIHSPFSIFSFSSQVMRKVEILRCMNLPLQAGEREFMARLEEVQMNLARPQRILDGFARDAKFKQQRIEALSRSSGSGGNGMMMSSNGGSGGGSGGGGGGKQGQSSALSEKDLVKLFTVLSEQRLGLAHLSEIMRKDFRDLELIMNNS